MKGKKHNYIKNIHNIIHQRALGNLIERGHLIVFLKNADLFSTKLIWVKSNKETFSLFISYIKKSFCVRWYILLVLIFQSFRYQNRAKIRKINWDFLSLSSSKNRLLSPRNHLHMFQRCVKTKHNHQDPLKFGNVNLHVKSCGPKIHLNPLTGLKR